MTLELWKGIALGSLFPWTLLMAVLFSKRKERADTRATDLLAERNKIGSRSLARLDRIADAQEDMAIVSKQSVALQRRMVELAEISVAAAKNGKEAT